MQFTDRTSRNEFLQQKIEAVYGQLTGNFSRLVRIEPLMAEAASVFPGLVPTRAELDVEAGRKLKDKLSLENDQALLLSHILAHPKCGTHLCHAMLLPRPETTAALVELDAQGFVDLGPVRVERQGRAVHLLCTRCCVGNRCKMLNMLGAVFSAAVST
jgi:thioesterase DpgC